MDTQKEIPLFRLIHRDNLKNILDTQMICCPNHENGFSNYKSIGETELINLRNRIHLPFNNNLTFRDYVAFYFGPRPVMLYAIKNGYNVNKLNQTNIIYIVTTFQKVKELSLNFVFSDGHGYAAITGWYNSENDLNEVDWRIVYTNQWYDTENDTDRKRRKQAEFLVEKQLPLIAVKKIITYDNEAKDFVDTLLSRYPNINYISAEINKSYYY